MTYNLPNGLTVDSLNDADTVMVYRDIFEDDCYRRHGVTLRDGDCILDVGANTGLFILFLNQILTRARVYAFEPIADIYQVLSRNVEKHNRLSVELFNVGLARKSGEATFAYYPRMSNCSTMYPDSSPLNVGRARNYILDQVHTLPKILQWGAKWIPGPIQQFVAEQIRRYYMKREKVTCQLLALPEVLRWHKITQVDLLKVDAERAEQEILESLGDDDWSRIQQLVLEVHRGEQATNEIVQLLQSKGYQVVVDVNPAIASLALVYAVRPEYAQKRENPRYLS